jgi:hypothetical protein
LLILLLLLPLTLLLLSLLVGLIRLLLLNLPLTGLTLLLLLILLRFGHDNRCSKKEGEEITFHMYEGDVFWVVALQNNRFLKKTKVFSKFFRSS